MCIRDRVYPGANAETVAQTVGIPIEQQVNGVDGMLYMSSNSSSCLLYTSGCGNIGNYDSCSYSLKGEGTFRAKEGTHP